MIITAFFKYAVLIEYDGTNFAGSQTQPNERTVQQVLEEALSVVLRQSIKVVFSGRTDTGVHALVRLDNLSLMSPLIYIKQCILLMDYYQKILL